MTHVHDDPARFMQDMLAGFLDLYSSAVVGVPGGVVRAAEPTVGKVAVVVGGGSGHYPAFCGIVGPGLADGAVVGHVFTSPSADDVVSVCRAASSGAGVFLTAGNYAGDVLNFDLARDRLNAEGVPTRTLFVTDDVASAAPGEVHRRRGIAGDLVVFKVAGAAAQLGYSLDEVARVASRANDRTRTLGVAFDGCTMPGEPRPLFRVPQGRMAVGLGIHGEAGIAEKPLASAADLARLLVDGVLAERPADGSDTVAVLLNGLGATTYEELFVLWGHIGRLLRDAALTLVEPEVGELVTSLDMAGCSLTVAFLDDELERLWSAPADSPSYRKGRGYAVDGGPRRGRSAAGPSPAEVAFAPASAASQSCGRTVVAALEAMRVLIVEAEPELARLDTVAGDGDHGRGMVRGLGSAAEAARSASERGAGAGSVLAAAGAAWAARAGGTSGALWGRALADMGRALADDADEIRAADVVTAVRAAATGIQALGRAQPGDKTMLDALVPFVDALEAEVGAGADLATAWTHGADVAWRAAADTALLRPRIGRARPLADLSVGTPDPGATSLAMSVRAVAGVLLDGRGAAQDR